MLETQAMAVTKVMTHRKRPRIWLQGRILESAGFAPAMAYTIISEPGSCELRLVAQAQGNRRVSGKSQARKVDPIIDINSADVLAVFATLERVKVLALPGLIVLMPLATDIKKAERLERIRRRLQCGEPLRIGSLAHGGGMLSKAVHEGLAAADVPSMLALANDIDGALLEHAARRNPAWDESTVMLSSPMQEVAFDTKLLQSLPQCDILEAGLSCTGASVAGRAKNGTACAEEHPDAGHLVVSFLVMVGALNPACVLLENVPPYRSSASMWIIRHQLRDLGYVVHETILDGQEWGVLDCRRRMCMVAVTEGMEFDFAQLMLPVIEHQTTVADILENVPLDSSRWTPMTHLLSKAVRDLEQGKNFQMQVVEPDATWIRTMGKGYNKNRGTEPKLRHPFNPELLRIFTPVEHARSKGEDPALVEGLSATAAHALLGQGVISPAFRGVGALIGRFLRIFARLPVSILVQTPKTPVHMPLVAEDDDVMEQRQLSLI